MRTSTTLTASMTALALTVVGCSSTPPDTTDPAPSQHPTAPAGLIVEANPADLAVPDDASAEVIHTPSATITTNTTTVETINADVISQDAEDTTTPTGTNQEVAPNAGEEFYVVTVSIDELDHPAADIVDNPTSDAAVALGFELNGTTHQQPETTQETSYVVSAAEDEPAWLTVTAADKTQKLDLHTGTRDDTTAAAGYYWDTPDIAADAISLPSINATGQRGQEQTVEANFAPNITIDEAAFTGWTPDEGWADDGDGWLVLSGTASTTRTGEPRLRGTTSMDLDISLDDDPTTTFTLDLEETKLSTDSTENFTYRIHIPDITDTITLDTTTTLDIEAFDGIELTSEPTASAEAEPVVVDVVG